VLAGLIMPTHFLTASALQDAGVEGTVRVLGYPGRFAEEYQDAVFNVCTEQYPGLEIEYVEGGGSADILAQLRAQGDNAEADVVIIDSLVAGTGNAEGIFQPLDPSIVTNMADLTEDALVADNYGPAVMFDNLVMLYNPEMTENTPTSWNALWDEEHAGRVAIAGPPNIQGIALTAIINNLVEGGDYHESIDPAMARLAELGPNVLTYDPQPDAYTMIISGEASIGIGWNARGQTFMDESDGKLEVVLPDEGSVYQKNTINLVSGIENPEAAQAFINCALSPEAQQAFSEAMFYAPVNTKTDLSDEILNRTAASPDIADTVVSLDEEFIAQVREEWLDRWRREVIQ
jgi:putative spermidine/putrescine transport system substrate-binding protein